MLHDLETSRWESRARDRRKPGGRQGHPTQGESPEFSGRAVAALAADARVMEKSGKALVVAELALEYGFTAIDGSQPASMLRPSS